MLQCSASLLDYPEWKRRQEYQKILRNICNGSSSTLSNGQCENTLRHPRATVNFKILLDIRVRQSIRKYSWTPAGLSHWNIGTRQTCMIWLLFIIRHVNSINHVNSVNSINSVNSVNSVNSINSVNSVNSVNSYSAVLPPSPMVFLFFQSQENRAFKKYITAYCNKSGNCAHSKSKSSLLVRYHQLLAPFSSFSLSVIRWYIYEKPPGWHYLFRPVSRAGRKWGIWEEIWGNMKKLEGIWGNLRGNHSEWSQPHNQSYPALVYSIIDQE